MYIPAISTFILGFILGYLGQRARMCFIGGMRDYVLIRDTYLLKGLFAFIISAFVGFAIFHLVSPAIKTFPWFINGKIVLSKKMSSPSFLIPVPGDPITWSPKAYAHVILAVIGGIGVGYFSVLAGGCPFRQHVMASEGSKSAWAYILGFLVGAIIFHTTIAPFIKKLF